ASLDRMTRALHLSGAAVLEFTDLGSSDPLAPEAPAHYDARVLSLLGCGDEAAPVLATWPAALHPEDRERVAASRSEQLQTAGERTLEYRVLVAGAVRWWHERSDVVVTGPGRGSVVAVVRDITDERAELEVSRRAT